MKSSNRKTSLTLLALGLAAILIASDFLIKNFVITHISKYSVVEAIPGLISFTYVSNDSAAFSIGFGITWVFTIISTAASLALIWYLRKIETIGWALMAGMLLGGICGNLLDRFIRPPFGGIGQVVDYIQIPFNFPVFNLADSLIVVTAVLTVLRIMAGHNLGKPSKTKERVASQTTND